MMRAGRILNQAVPGSLLQSLRCESTALPKMMQIGSVAG